MALTFSLHAERRMRQRGIPPLIVDLLYHFGAVERSHRAERLLFNKPAKARLSRALGARSMAIIEKWMSVYAVVSDETGELITVGHRRHRFKRK